jgi:murein DD-endopeptidase MepM/ murein hydrolase activator NlpD
MRGQRQTFPVIAGLLLIAALFVGLLWRNRDDATLIVTPIGLPTEAEPTPSANPLSVLLSMGQSTALPTVAIPSVMPTIPQIVPDSGPTATTFSASVLGVSTPDLVAQGSLPTAPAATPTRPEESVAATVQVVTRAPVAFQPPPLIPPLSSDPLGRDHYWLMRPIDSNAQNSPLSIYTYGSDGNDPNNPLRVHHGIDMPNPVGEIVRAAGSGTVIYSADGRQASTDIFQNSPSYGNVIVIEHDFGYNGKRIWTLYAHLSSAFVQAGQVVQAGEPIGQVGRSGNVTGPHLHLEVRLGNTPDDNRYGNTYNPILWIVPYVGHGVIAGRVVDANGRFVNDADITVRSFATNLVQATTTSYVFAGSGFDVNSDPVWNENFAVPDVPAGRYNVIATINGERVVRQVEVFPGTTAFVELKPASPATSTPDGG